MVLRDVTLSLSRSQCFCLSTRSLLSCNCFLYSTEGRISGVFLVVNNHVNLYLSFVIPIWLCYLLAHLLLNIK